MVMKSKAYYIAGGEYGPNTRYVHKCVIAAKYVTVETRSFRIIKTL